MLHQAYTNRCLCDCLILRWHSAFAREGCQLAELCLILQWHAVFAREGCHLAELIPYGGRPVTVRTEVNVNTVAVAIREKHHSSILKLAELLNISRISVN